MAVVYGPRQSRSGARAAFVGLIHRQVGGHTGKHASVFCVNTSTCALQHVQGDYQDEDKECCSNIALAQAVRARVRTTHASLSGNVRVTSAVAHRSRLGEDVVRTR